MCGSLQPVCSPVGRLGQQTGPLCMSQTGGVLARRPSTASRDGQQGCTRGLFSLALFLAKSPRWHFASPERVVVRRGPVRVGVRGAGPRGDRCRRGRGGQGARSRAPTASALACASAPASAPVRAPFRARARARACARSRARARARARARGRARARARARAPFGAHLGGAPGGRGRQ